MKIKTRLRFNTIFLTVILLLTGLILFNVSKKDNRAIQDNKTINRIGRAIFEINILTNDYLLDQSEQVKMQWLLRYDSLSMLIKSIELKSGEESLLIDEIWEHRIIINDIFFQLAAAYKRTEDIEEADSRAAELRQRLADSLIIKSQVLVSAAEQLSDITGQKLISAHNNFSLIVMMLIVVSLILMVINLMFVGKNILKPILNLQEGSRIIGEGNLDYKIGMTTKDEIGELANSFDQMTENLKTITVSRDELEKEIIERKQAEETLQQTEERYRNLFEEAPIMYVITRYHNGEPHIVDCNDLFLRSLGYSRDQILDKPISDFYTPESVAKLREGGFRKARPGTFTEERQLIDRDGRIIETVLRAVSDGDAGDQETGTRAMFLDITKRKQAEEALAKSEAFLNTTGQMAKVGGWEIDGKTKKVFWTKEIYNITEAPPDYDPSSLDKEAIVFFNAEDQLRLEKAIQRAFEHNEPYNMELQITTAKGNKKWVRAICEPIVVDGKVVKLNGTFQDINYRKQAEEEKTKLETQLQQAQKMESIGTLAGGIAHDFNNILSPIMIHTEMAMMELPSGSPLQQSMKQIYKAGERATDLVKQILTFARIGGDERAPIGISLILKEVVKFLRSTIPTIVDIQYRIEAKHDIVLADPTQMNQIIMNLCTNAAHAMEENGGTLEVILTNENLDSESADDLPGLEPGRYVKLTVKDTGQGIEPQFMDKIFEPYFTTKEVGKGTGMGLALVHGIVKNYGGAVTVKSEVGKGTSFHVYLPLVEDDTDVLETAKGSVQLPTGTERILFVDDEKAAADVMQSMLEKLGYKVTARTSSIEALELFRNKPDIFDLVITDMTMPNMTGKDLARELMSIRSDMPIILCTGFSEKIDERRAEEMGIRAFVMKPIVMGQIANTIREVLDKK